MMKEILTINRDNSLIRIPKRWLNDNLPPGDYAKVLREIDGDRIIITAIQGETDNANTNSK